ncbi:MAG: GcrA family cell cycle regulator [Alphaproteobacteria bacterium]|nr:GcrA family cell cycle regulator [Alphaproteobacteria bacterium]
MSKGWDNATLKKLKALTGKGLSTSEIGKRLGMSKNAIVGKLNRLGWNAKAGGAASAEVTEKKTATAKKTATTVKKVAEKRSVVKKGPAKTTKEAVKVVVKETAKKTESKATTNKAVAKKEVTTKVEKSAPAAKKSDAKSLAVHQRIIQHSLEMANLKPNQCRWPIGDPDSEHFHFCGETVFVGKPYCYEHCKQAYQFAPPKKK